MTVFLLVWDLCWGLEHNVLIMKSDTDWILCVSQAWTKGKAVKWVSSVERLTAGSVSKMMRFDNSHSQRTPETGEVPATTWISYRFCIAQVDLTDFQCGRKMRSWCSILENDNVYEGAWLKRCNISKEKQKFTHITVSQCTKVMFSYWESKCCIKRSEPCPGQVFSACN